MNPGNPLDALPAGVATGRYDAGDIVFRETVLHIGIGFQGFRAEISGYRGGYRQSLFVGSRRIPVMPLLKGSGAGDRDIAIGFIRQGILKTVFPRHRSPRFIAGFCDVQIDKSRGGVGIRAAGDDGRAVSADIPADINRRAVILRLRIICGASAAAQAGKLTMARDNRKAMMRVGFIPYTPPSCFGRLGGAPPNGSACPAPSPQPESHTARLWTNLSQQDCFLRA